MRAVTLIILAVCLAWTFLLSKFDIDAAADQSALYLGVKACSSCHETIVKAWEKTKHASAFESLKKTSQDNLPACQQCHVTGFEETGGFIDAELTPELVGVQCEECHGPGKAHAADPDKRGNIIAEPAETKCRKCHVQGQDPNFDYNKKARLIH